MSVNQIGILDQSENRTCSLRSGRQPVLLVVEDWPEWSAAIQGLCDCLEVTVEPVSSHLDLTAVLDEHRPMAVLAGMEAAGQDGCHVLKSVARHDPSVPVLLLTTGDAALEGAADAVAQIWGLSDVLQRPELPPAGEFVEFLFRAGLKGRCLGLVPG